VKRHAALQRVWKLRLHYTLARRGTEEVDVALSGANDAGYDALVLPGGQINPDLQRLNDDALALIKAFYAAGKPTAAICYTPWLLIESGLVNKRKMTSYQSIKTDMINAGAKSEDKNVVTDGGIGAIRSTVSAGLGNASET
jgi:protease I